MRCQIRGCKKPVSGQWYCDDHWDEMDRELAAEFPAARAKLNKDMDNLLGYIDRSKRHEAARKAVGKRAPRV